ncbi:hypothetical protein GF356_10845 [candidate division GN15 bacterium]|nr:hypothetical protein [candidate division GN15 bacterium]
MHRRISPIVLAALIVVTVAPGAIALSSDEQLENTIAFARLYGYVRFFYPSDEAASVDWEAFAVVGAEETKGARDSKELERILLELFVPVAPSLEISTRLPESTRSPETTGQTPVTWQHFGVWLSDQTYGFGSQRLNRKPDQEAFFEKHAVLGEYGEYYLGRGLWCRWPLAVALADNRTMPESDRETLEALQRRLLAAGTAERSYRDEGLRLAAVVMSWNVFKHFYPYFDVVEVDWEQSLRTAIESALLATDRSGLVASLERMIAGLEDCHAVVFDELATGEMVPAVRFAFVDESIVVMGTDEGSPLMQGDVITEIDGVAVGQALAQLKKRVSGGEAVRQHRALNLLGRGLVGSTATIGYIRSGKTNQAAVPRNREMNLFFSKTTPWEYPVFRVLDNGVAHVNLRHLDKVALSEILGGLIDAEAIVLDYRWGGNNGVFELLKHLAEGPVESPRWHMPLVVYPNLRDVEYEEVSWTLEPNEPHIAAPVVVLQNPSVVSAGETFLGIVEFYEIATLIGERSGGCNGNANFIPLPGGLRVMFTGMRTEKQDGSQHHVIGIRPDFQVEPTIAGLTQGRDEVLEFAVRVLDKEAARLAREDLVVGGVPQEAVEANITERRVN